MIPIEDIRAAARRIAGHVHRTPVFSTAQLSARCGVRLSLKCESLQKTGSFKARGALNKVLSLSEAERARGLVTVSAGNHAAAVAWAASVAGCGAVVVMPTDAPASKLEAVRGYGAEIVLHDDRPTLFDRLNEVREARGLTFVHPFDDPVVLAGAGTTGLEMTEDVGDVELVVVPVGGGGLLGGITSAVKQTKPGARVVAVELAEGPGLAPAIAAGKPVPGPPPRDSRRRDDAALRGRAAAGHRAGGRRRDRQRDRGRDPGRDAPPDDPRQALRRGLGSRGDRSAPRRQDPREAGLRHGRHRVGRQHRPRETGERSRPSTIFPDTPGWRSPRSRRRSRRAA